MQEAIATTIAGHDPTHVPSSCEELAVVAKAIEQKGEWVDWDEWRISTGFQSRIVRQDWYEAAAECDGQRLARVSADIRRPGRLAAANPTIP
jgi:hypothetical protein